MKKIYLASPYSHPDPAVREQRFHDVCTIAARLMQDGHIVFSPIAHSHPISQHMGNALDLEYWLAQERAFVEWADEVWVATLPGYFESKGVRQEMAWAREMGKNVGFVGVP